MRSTTPRKREDSHRFVLYNLSFFMVLYWVLFSGYIFTTGMVLCIFLDTLHLFCSLLPSPVFTIPGVDYISLLFLLFF